jgi:hypothetical protein
MKYPAEIKYYLDLIAALFLIFPTGCSYSPGSALSPDLSFSIDNYYESYINRLYENLDTDSYERPEFKVFEKALTGFFRLKKRSLVSNNIVVLIDFSLPSDKERMWIIDMVESSITGQMLVSHGKNSGDLFAESLSNTPTSYQSSPGFYATGDIYYGRHGMSLYLDGIESGINDKARERAIVMHSAAYVSHEFIQTHGRLGRSHGCPAIPIENHEQILQSLAGGSCLFIYHPSIENRSELLAYPDAFPELCLSADNKGSSLL